MGVFVAVAATTTLSEVGAAAGAGAVIFLAGAWALNRLGAPADKSGAVQALQSPLDLVSVARFALFLGAIIAIGRVLSDAYGQAGLLPFAATAGVADVDAVALAVGSLVRGGLDHSLGARAILVAVLVNTFSKAAIAAASGGWRYGAYYLGVALAATAVSAAVWFVATPWLTPMFSFEPSHPQHGFG
jgi:uncharacterized membrane protein (DUF4010 family)